MLVHCCRVISVTVGLVALHTNKPVIFCCSLFQARDTQGMWLSEFVDTFGLLATILSCSHHNVDATPYAVGLYIFARTSKLREEH